jgi:GNAT superfamily N-acetyltransferase
LQLSELYFTELTPDHDLSLFDCDDKDINEFLKEDALKYQEHRMANTYLFLEENHCVAAFFSISNDCLTDLGEDRGFNKTAWNRFHRKQNIPNSKRIKQYPSIKIGRLGVSKKYHGTGLSYELMKFIKGYSIIEHKPAVRLLILDAYNKDKQINFYTRNGFTFMLDTDTNSKTRLMIYDLLKLS